MIMNMILSNKCPKCGNSRIAGPHRLHAYQHLSVDLPGPKTATLESFTCASCGFTEFYADKKGVENINEVGRFLTESSSRLNDSSERWCLTCGQAILVKTQFCSECGSHVD